MYVAAECLACLKVCKQRMLFVTPLAENTHMDRPEQTLDPFVLTSKVDCKSMEATLWLIRVPHTARALGLNFMAYGHVFMSIRISG